MMMKKTATAKKMNKAVVKVKAKIHQKWNNNSQKIPSWVERKKLQVLEKKSNNLKLPKKDK